MYVHLVSAFTAHCCACLIFDGCILVFCCAGRLDPFPPRLSRHPHAVLGLRARHATVDSPTRLLPAPFHPFVWARYQLHVYGGNTVIFLFLHTRRRRNRNAKPPCYRRPHASPDAHGVKHSLFVRNRSVHHVSAQHLSAQNALISPPPLHNPRRWTRTAHSRGSSRERSRPGWGRGCGWFSPTMRR